MQRFIGVSARERKALMDGSIRRTRNPPWNPCERHTCEGCGAQEGELHRVFGCEDERCPFCDGQLLFCLCCYKKLGLLDRVNPPPEEDGLALDSFTEVLTAEEQRAWEAILQQHGRIPYIAYPGVCARCGILMPDPFMVPDEEWNYYIQRDQQGVVLCRACYVLIVHWIDSATKPFYGVSTSD
jgi:hypothetical protein